MKKILTLISIAFIAFSCSSNDDGNTNGDTMTCSTPSNITSSSITTNSATINWSSGENSVSYQIEYGETGFGLGNGTTVSSNTPNITLNGLNSNTVYQVYVKANCGEDGLSDWSGASNFTTPEQTCSNPTDLQIFNITDTSATLVWITNEPSATYDVEYGISGFGIGNGTVITTSNNSLELTGLVPSTQYEYFVKTNCSNTNTSDYAGPSIFMTDSACSMPSDLNFFDLQACSFEIFWNSSGETAWEIEYGEVGFSLGNGTVINTSNTTYSITENLAPNSTYEVYVRSNCGSQGFSNYTDPIVVTTNAIDELFLIGEYLIQDVDANVGPGNGTQNFPNGTVTLNFDDSDPNKRIFYSNVLPAFNTESEEIILEINSDGSISINDVDPTLSCGTGNYILTSAGANNTVVTSCGDNDFIIINYTEDPSGSCGGPFDASFSLTKQ